VGLTPFSSWNKDGKQINFLKEKNTMDGVYFNLEEGLNKLNLPAANQRLVKRLSG
jgi:hypothetical protein